MKHVSLPDAYPLQWPAGWPRTPATKRSNSSYRVTETKARDELVEAIYRLGGVSVIISTNLPARADGIPYTGCAAPADPGVAVYWVRAGRQEVMACDRWLRPWENMRAVYHGIEALRAMERAGATQIMERAFQAFQLPTGGSANWRDVLGYDIQTREAASKAFKALALKLHPDVGGDIEKFKEAEAAHRAALQELGERDG